MYKSVRVVVFYLYCVIFTAGEICPVFCPDYYWRDYTGEIPSDAFVGAVDGTETLYVGQAFFQQYDLLPATIYNSTRLAHTTTFVKMLVTDENVKILASPDSSIFQWVPIHNRDLHLYLNRAIPGGSELGEHIYIGRVRHGGKMIIGKVFKHHHRKRGLWIQQKGQRYTNYIQYDLLTFNCNKRLSEITTPEKILIPQ